MSAVFITGGGAGIGAGLARVLHARGHTVVIAGRTPDKLAAVAATCPGMETVTLDVTDAAAVAEVAADVGRRHADLDLVINNAGIQQILDFRGPEPIAADVLVREVDTNLKGLLYVSNAFLPLLRRVGSSAKRARLVHVGSGLGYVPLAMAPVYSATKAAVHSFTISLRFQLASSGVQVVEIVPPVVETELHRSLARMPPRALPLDKFIAATLRGLDGGGDEVHVGLANVLRFGSRIAPGFFFGVVNKPQPA